MSKQQIQVLCLWPHGVMEIVVVDGPRSQTITDPEQVQGIIMANADVLVGGDRPPAEYKGKWLPDTNAFQVSHHVNQADDYYANAAWLEAKNTGCLAHTKNGEPIYLKGQSEGDVRKEVLSPMGYGLCLYLLGRLEGRMEYAHGAYVDQVSILANLGGQTTPPITDHYDAKPWAATMAYCFYALNYVTGKPFYPNCISYRKDEQLQVGRKAGGWMFEYLLHAAERATEHGQILADLKDVPGLCVYKSKSDNYTSDKERALRRYAFACAAVNGGDLAIQIGDNVDGAATYKTWILDLELWPDLEV